MSSAVDRIDLDCRRNFETSLFEAETHAAGAGEQIDRYGPSFCSFYVIFTIRHNANLPIDQALVDRNLGIVQKCQQPCHKRIGGFELALPNSKRLPA